MFVSNDWMKLNVGYYFPNLMGICIQIWEDIIFH